MSRSVCRALSWVGRARRGAGDLASLVLMDGVVAHRYQGSSPLAGGAPLDLFFVGREEYAREFELYFDGAEGCAIRRRDVTFRGTLPRYSLHRARLEREAATTDLVAWEMFPGSLAADVDEEAHFPMLAGHLRVERSIEQQLRRVRSRAQRRVMRQVLRRDEFRVWLDGSAGAFERFHQTLHAPYVRARFGERGIIDDREKMRSLFTRCGRVLFVAPKTRTEPVCATLLLDAGRGVLTYQINGFSRDTLENERLLAERTAALELAVMRHAIQERFEEIDFGYTRAILNSGLFVHKRRLGCSFAPVPESPRFRLWVRPERRASLFAAFPLLIGAPEPRTIVLGFDDAAPRMPKQRWRAALKSYRVPGLAKAIVWSNAGGEGARDALGEPCFLEALRETLELPEGVDLRRV